MLVKLILFTSLVLFAASRNLEPSSDIFNFRPRKDCKCGLAQRATRIVGGKETEVNEYPWQAGLVRKGGSSHHLFCGGSLLNTRWVLTAAHCNRGMKPSDIQVVLGEHDIWKKEETESVRMNVMQINIHPKYERKTLDYDFSMLQLEKSVNYGKFPHIRPVCLPSNSQDTFAGDTATITGWGRTQAVPVARSSQLQEVNVKVLTNKQCRASYGEKRISDRMICAAAPGKDSCQGDSGGPMVTAKGGDGVTPGQNYQLIGVVSWGSACASPDYPGVYARVTNEIRWIRGFLDKTGESCGDQ